MRNITKSAEPVSLTAWRATDPTDYNGYKEKDVLRDSLAREQRGICCYCQCRIRPEIGSMKVEHWHSHDRFPNERLVYRNLLGGCMGGEGTRGRDQHCDTYKGDKGLCLNPADPSYDIEAVIHFLNDGRVTSTYAPLDKELNSVLNLNQEFLQNNRKRVLESFKLLLRKKGTLNRGEWEHLLERWTGRNHDGELEPYCGVIIYWIRKRLAREA